MKNADDIFGADPDRLKRLMETGLSCDENDPSQTQETDASVGQFMEQTGEQIGRYKLLEKIGEGGFGTVYVAQQRSPVTRRVALKIIKPGMDTKQVVARFEAERQALAMMDHPNIARVLDAGATPSGRPYFVMELVKGIPLTEYCNQAKLDTRVRLDLFIKVCHAIQHAHQKGIIHRDIKPTNILVTLHDGVPVPKVIDFGIAKATQQELTDKTIYTQFSQFIGTPAYMSPEQAEMSGLDIDTRSDVYALGVLLYELLTGSTPFDTTELIQSGLDEMRKIIREREPLKPSTRLTQMQTGDKFQKTKPSSQIDRDLDWIVMKCLEKDRAHRYETANGLAMDIQRHLNSQPIVARPPSTAYRLQKAWRRNKLLYASVAAVVFALVIGTIISSWQASVAKKARASAERGEYLARMNMMQNDWQMNNMARVWESLEQTGSYPNRGLEWHFWQQQLHQEIGTLVAHPERVGNITFSPDGRHFTTVSNDGTIKLWETGSWKLVRTFMGHTGWVRDAAFSPDGRWLLSSSSFKDVTARIWEVASGRTIVAFKDLQQIIGIDWSADGRRLVMGGTSREVAYLWNVSQIDFNTLAHSATDHGPAEVWALDSPHLIHELRHGSGIWDVAFSSDGEHLLVGFGGGGNPAIVRLWQLGGSKPVYRNLEGHRDKIWSVDFSTDDQWIISTSSDRTAIVWDTATGEPLDQLEGHAGWVFHGVFSKDGKRILTTSNAGPAKLWQWNGKEARDIHTLKGHRTACWAGVFLPNNEQQLVTACADGTIKLWDLSILQPLRLEQETWVTSMAFLDNGRRLLTGDPNGIVRLWNVETRQIERTFPGNSTEVQDGALLTVSPDERWFAAVSDDRNSVRVWDITSGREKYPKLQHIAEVSAVAISPNGQWIVTGVEDELAHVWYADNGEKYFDFKGNRDSRLPPGYSSPGTPINGVTALAFSSDGRLWIGQRTGPVTIWDLDRRKQVGELPNALSVHEIVISSDGKIGVTVVRWPPAIAWCINTREEIFRLVGHKEIIDGVFISSNGRRILTESWDGTTKLWETTTGQEVLSLPGRHGVLSSDGKRIATAEGTLVRVWTVANTEQVKRWQQSDAEWLQELEALQNEQ